MSSNNNASIFEIPVAIRWKILKETLRAQSEEKDWCIFSEKFYLEQLPGVSYHLKMQQRNEAYGENAIIGLTINIGHQPKIKAVFKISIPSVNYTFQGENVYDKRQFAGNMICTTTELFNPSNDFFLDDYMIVKMEGVLSVECGNPDNTLMYVQMNSCRRGLKLWDRDDKDFAFIVGDQEIRVHKPIVSAESPVFDRMIHSGLKETVESKVKIVDFDFEVVETAVKFCYGIKEKTLWNMETAIKLLQFADKYDIEDLKAAMETFLASTISQMNVCIIANSAILSNSSKLGETCFEFMLECNREQKFIKDLNTLDNDFALRLLEASFYCSSN